VSSPQKKASQWEEHYRDIGNQILGTSTWWFSNSLYGPTSEGRVKGW